MSQGALFPPEPFAEYPFNQKHRHFWSGLNHEGEVRGAMTSGCWPGITASAVNEGLLAALDEHGGVGPTRLFVDSGAFGEVEFGPLGRRVVDPITHEQWTHRFEKVYERCASNWGHRCYLVAPDSVGDQDATLARLRLYSDRVRRFALEWRARIIVPVQKGALTMAQFWLQEREALGLRDDSECVVAGIPMKKDATTLEDLAEFMKWLPVDWDVHLLGMSPANSDYTEAMGLCQNTWRTVTSDAAEVRRLAGRTNGKGGQPRAITAAQDEARRLGLTSGDVKAHAIAAVSLAAHDADKKRAREMGWVDEGD